MGLQAKSMSIGYGTQCGNGGKLMVEYCNDLGLCCFGDEACIGNNGLATKEFQIQGQMSDAKASIGTLQQGGQRYLRYERQDAKCNRSVLFTRAEVEMVHGSSARVLSGLYASTSGACIGMPAVFPVVMVAYCATAVVVVLHATACCRHSTSRRASLYSSSWDWRSRQWGVLRRVGYLFAMA
eukprot:GHRR01001028.1.p1 GENE.GHRR01001028.1~~GHRR01001028.1.p1  ORF type:complete len:182 (+),score=27.77 GHRR01001028.1:167-712(+)